MIGTDEKGDGRQREHSDGPKCSAMSGRSSTADAKEGYAEARCVMEAPEDPQRQWRWTPMVVESPKLLSCTTP